MQYTNEQNKLKITKEVSEIISRKALKEKRDYLKTTIDVLQEEYLLLVNCVTI